MYSAQFPATGDVGTAAGSLTEGVGQAAWRQGAAAQRRNEQKWNMLWLMLQYVANIWNMCADLSQNLIAYIGWLFFLDNSALFTVFTASGQTKAVHNPAHCAGFADAFGGACHDDFATRNFPVCKLEGSVSRQNNQIWLASSCILGQDSVEVRCRKCDEAEMEIQGRYPWCLVWSSWRRRRDYFACCPQIFSWWGTGGRMHWWCCEGIQ